MARNYTILKLNSCIYQKRLQHPGQRLQQQMQSLDQLEQRLFNAIKNQLQRRKEQLTLMSRNLDTVSPLNTLKRGYAIVTKGETIITKSKQAKSGDRITARLAEGTLDCTVIE